LVHELLNSIKKSENEKFIKIEIELDLEEGITIFNGQPSKGIDYLISAGLVQETVEGIVNFLSNNLKNLSPLQVAKFIGRQTNEKVLETFISTFKFEKMEFLNALRYFLSFITLTNEKDSDERILKKFCQEYFKQNKDLIDETYKTSQSLFSLSTFIIQLNHSVCSGPREAVKTKKKFVESILNEEHFGKFLHSKTFEKELEAVYEEILQEPIEEKKLFAQKETKECYTKKVKLKKRDISVSILDNLVPAGQNDFSSLEAASIREGDGFLLVYDVSDEVSFFNVKNYYKKIQRCKGEDAIMFLVGNKIDLQDKRQVSYRQGHELATSLGIPFFETSSDSIPNSLLSLQNELEKISKGDDFFQVEKNENQVLEVNDIFMKLIWALECLHQSEESQDEKKCLVM
jgi:small GTP-binding protein